MLEFFFDLVMMTRPRLSIKESWMRIGMKVVVLNEKEYSKNSIAKRFKIGRRTVQEIIKK